MKQRIIISMTIYVFFNSGLSAQNVDKMNKSELRDYIGFLITKIDSLKNENFILQESLSTLFKKSSLLGQENNSNQIEISRLNELILNYENEKKRINSENETTIAMLNETISALRDSMSIAHSLRNIDDSSTIAKLNETILALRDSMSIVHSESNDVSTITTFNSNDFLNKYYFDQVPLPNNSFSLVLTKLIYGDVQINDRDYYSDNDKGGVIRIPEILDPNNFTYWGVKPNVITRGKVFNDLVFANNSNFLDSKLPKIEVLKNKLFTLKYLNGTEESFLFNSKKNGSVDENNDRGILQIELANEEVKEDGSNNTAKDIVWRFFIIGNECYLALSTNQLNRIGLMIQTSGKIQYYLNGNLHNDEYFSDNYYYNNNPLTSGNGIYLSRNKDSYMESSKYIDPKNLIYLFKLK